MLPNQPSNREKSRRPIRSTVIGQLNEGWEKAMTSRRFGFGMYIFGWLLYHLQVEAVLEDFERRTADTEDKDTVCTCTRPFVTHLCLPY
jgi:hypothetical protein